MLKQWLCSKRLLFFVAAPGVLTVTDDMLSFFPMSGNFVSPVEMHLRDVVQVTSTLPRGLVFGRVSIASLDQSMTLNIHRGSAEIVAKFVQSAVDRVKSPEAERVGETPHVT